MAKLFDGENVQHLDVNELNLIVARLMMGSTLVYTQTAKSLGKPDKEMEAGYLELYNRVARDFGEDETADLHAHNSIEILLAKL